MRIPEPTLTQVYDTLFLDLDGTLMNGGTPIPGAAAGVEAARAAGTKIVFATNNASRRPDQVIAHLKTVGVEGEENEVITSVQVAMDLLHQYCEPGDAILVIGGPSLADGVNAAGFKAVYEATAKPSAVIQGWSAEVGWPQLAQGMYAITAGAKFIATNTDKTLPTEFGMAPGNGSLVQCLVHATGVQPEVAGKPQPAMFQVAAKKFGAKRPIAVGDRLDTDIEGGNRAGIDSLLVLTGVSSIDDALHAEPIQRPTHLLWNLIGLNESYHNPVIDEAGLSAKAGAASAILTGKDATSDIELVGITDFQTAIDAARAALALVRSVFPESAWTGKLSGGQLEYLSQHPDQN